MSEFCSRGTALFIIKSQFISSILVSLSGEMMVRFARFIDTSQFDTVDGFTLSALVYFVARAVQREGDLTKAYTSYIFEIFYIRFGVQGEPEIRNFECTKFLIGPRLCGFLIYTYGKFHDLVL